MCQPYIESATALSDITIVLDKYYFLFLKVKL